jgi:nicotinamidase-related amidase
MVLAPLRRRAAAGGRHRHQRRRRLHRARRACRDFDVAVLADGCAAFSPETHRVAIEALRPVCRVFTVADALAELDG